MCVEVVLFDYHSYTDIHLNEVAPSICAAEVFCSFVNALFFFLYRAFFLLFCVNIGLLTAVAELFSRFSFKIREEQSHITL